MSNITKFVLAILIAILVADVYLLIKTHNEHAPVVRQCLEFINQKQYKEAIEYGKSHTELKSPALWACMADAYYDLGDTEHALDAYKSAQELQESFWYRYYDPELEVHIYTRIAEIHEGRNDIDDAIMYYRKALKSMKADRKTIRSVFEQKYRETLLKIASLYEKEGDLENAEEYRSCAERLCKQI
jgi:tetratricopeptide (TPR) repeat protein